MFKQDESHCLIEEEEKTGKQSTQVRDARDSSLEDELPELNPALPALT